MRVRPLPPALPWCTRTRVKSVCPKFWGKTWRGSFRSVRSMRAKQQNSREFALVNKSISRQRDQSLIRNGDKLLIEIYCSTQLLRQRDSSIFWQLFFQFFERRFVWEMTGTGSTWVQGRSRVDYRLCVANDSQPRTSRQLSCLGTTWCPYVFLACKYTTAVWRRFSCHFFASLNACT